MAKRFCVMWLLVCRNDRGGIQTTNCTDGDYTGIIWIHLWIYIYMYICYFNLKLLLFFSCKKRQLIWEYRRVHPSALQSEWSYFPAVSYWQTEIPFQNTSLPWIGTEHIHWYRRLRRLCTCHRVHYSAGEPIVSLLLFPSNAQHTLTSTTFQTTSTKIQYVNVQMRPFFLQRKYHHVILISAVLS